MPDSLTPWWSPGVYHVAPGVARIPLALPTSVVATNVYVLTTERGLVLVDGGWSQHPPAVRQLEVGLAKLGAGLGDVTRFLVTHLHRDHYTYAVEHRAAHGGSVAVGAGEAASLEVLQASNSRPTSEDLAMLQRCGAADIASGIDLLATDPTVWGDPDEWLDPGPVPGLEGVLVAVPTPGHTHGHLVFIDDARGLAFTGDHVLPLTLPAAGSEQVRQGSALTAQLASLRAMVDLPDHRSLPAHGPTGESLHARSREIAAQLERRVEDCLEIVDRRLSVIDVARRMTWSSQHARFNDLSPWDAKRALTKVLSYLEHLVETGRLGADEREGILHVEPDLPT